ncbi:MAG: 4-hydroxybenzoate octaprenyltransferase [Gammaproteobacteria bacterium]|nr:4-hydroxybenzoate octaprenyltransferase [Gammaproteobacteria bacterium]
MRLDKPIGIALLWWPTAWALWTAGNGHPDGSIILYFFLGTIVMRSAGCVMNDIADRRIDLHVSRTRNRPLAAGEIGLLEAFLWLGGLCVVALWILLQLPRACFYYALPALILALSYPFFKRFFPTPQMVLSLAFSMGIPMSYVAQAHSFDASMWMLMLINVLWVLAYDTAYACVDKLDDEQIGVHSTARFFGYLARYWVIGLLFLMHLCWWGVIILLGEPKLLMFAWCVAVTNLMYQGRLLLSPQPANWFHAFKLNAWYGFWMWLGLFI